MMEENVLEEARYMDFSEIIKLFANIGMTEAIKKTVEAVICTHIKPLLAKHAETKDRSFEIEECLREYLQVSYKKAVIMNTIVFRGTDKLLFDLYIPLTLIQKSIDNDSCVYFRMDEEYNECLEKFNKLLIVDTAGMGKSTLVKFLTVQVINDDKYIPIVIELRKLTKGEKILDYILKQFQLIDQSINENELLFMIKRGDFVIFLDGYDEVISENRGHIMDDIQDLALKAPNNKFVMTSREESDLNCLGGFQEFSIKPLKMRESFELIKKYDNDGKMSKKLIERIQKDNRLDILREFLVNPLLTSLLYKTFEYKEEITYKKTKFYSQVYEALFNDHDKTKGSAYVHPKKSRLDQDDFEKVLRRIGFLSLQKSRVEFGRQELYDMIKNAAVYMPWMDVSVGDFIDDVTHSVPLFQKDGTEYKWVHKSFMEYFAACFICYDSNKCKEYISQIKESRRIQTYINVLDFCYDMKPDVCRDVIIKPMVEDYIDFYNSMYIDKYFDAFPIEYKNIRRSLEFQNQFILYHFSSRNEASEKFAHNEEKFFSDEKITSLQWVAVGPNGDLVCGKEKNQAILLELLFNKNIDIFASPHSAVDKCELKIKKEKYYVNDDVNNKLNTLDNFCNVTDILYGCVSEQHILDIDKCKRMKQAIDEEESKYQDILFDLL